MSEQTLRRKVARSRGVHKVRTNLEKKGEYEDSPDEELVIGMYRRYAQEVAEATTRAAELDSDFLAKRADSEMLNRIVSVLTKNTSHWQSGTSKSAHSPASGPTI